MAALVDGQRYGLSSQGQNSENRTLIFVKLTDSALRAIEEYLNLRGSTSRQPSIQFQGNQGVIRFPSSHNEHSFDFTFSPSSETEGIQGSFECIKKNGSRSLDSLGSMQYKMHIHAKDDVYQTTRVRMAAAEEESKKNCTKVIKAAGPYVGRKVKVKKGLSAIPPRPVSTSPPYTSSNSISSYSKTSSSMNKPNLTNGHHQYHHTNGSGNSFQGNNSSSNSNNNNSNNSNNNNNNNNNNGVLSTKNGSNQKISGNPDIMKKSYRERIIHLLAVRPYKKPELLARLMKDGIKEKDKKTLTSILCQVAVMRENTYQLARHIWPEVQEDWPFYNEVDKQLLKRRMPQNLTPPGDGSVSPSNVSSSSPPTLLKRRAPNNNTNTNNNNNKNNLNSKSNPNNSAIPPSKKQRISHYVRQTETKLASDVHPDGHHQGNNMHKLDKFDRMDSRMDSSSSSSNKLDKTNVGLTSNGHVQEMSDNSNVVKLESSLSKMESSGFLSTIHSTYGLAKENKSNGYGSNVANGSTTNNTGRCNGQLMMSSSSALCNGSTGGSHQSTPNSSPDSQDNVDSTGSSSQHSNDGSTIFTDLPDYLKKYAVITNAEQRAMYKHDFNAEYEEYRELHSAIERVSKRFSDLEEQLRNCEEGSEDSRRIKDEIMKEYKENKRNEKYQSAKLRFNYLHQKLSHIKKLVIGYDNTYS